MDVDEQIELVGGRTDVLRALEGTQLDPRELRDRTGDSRATINRALRELEDADLVRRENGSYALTAAGRIALDHHRRYRDERADLIEAGPLLSALPGDVDLDLEVLVGGEVVRAPQETPYRPIQRVHEAVDDADRYRAALPVLGDPRHVRLLYEHVVTDGDPAELVVPEPLRDSLTEEFPRRLAAMADPDGGAFDVLVGDSLDVGLVLTEADGKKRVTVVVPGSDGGVRALVRNDTPEAVRWAEDQYERIRSAATAVTDGLRQVEDGGVVVGDPVGPPGSSADPEVLVTLEREGFVRLSRDYFLDREVAAPTTAWRAGLDVEEVHTGYAVERRTAEGTTLCDRLLAGLRDGETQVILGPPGSGKSTTAKRVACEWYDRDLGPVFYRETGRGTTVRSVDGLVATLEASEGHALVVVEDAVRPDAEAVFEAAARLSDRADVSFLVDARETEWHDPPGEPRTSDVGPRIERMPELRDADVERLVEHFERTAGVTVDAPVERLREEGQSSTPDGSAPGEMLLLLHRLSTYADPLSEAATSLESDAAALYGTVADDDRALDAAVAANLLNAAGIGVTATHLHAVVGTETDDALRAVLEDLDGRVLFGRDDDGAYRTVHEAWSATFLETLLAAEGEADARKRVGRCASAVLSLADDPALRERVRRATPDPRTVERIATDPGEWADATTDRLFAVGEKRPKLSPLFGAADGPSIALPAACEAMTPAECTARLGEMYADAGAYDEARTVAKAGMEGIDEGSGIHCRLLGVLARAGCEQGDFERAREAARRRVELADGIGSERQRREALYRLGRVEREQGEFRAARDRLERALSLAEEAGDRRTEADALTELGLVAYHEGAYDTAREHHDDALAIRRALEDNRREATCLGNLGLVHLKRGEYDRAQRCFERNLAIKRDVGDRQGESHTLGNLGVVYKRRGEYDRAEEYFERDLAIKRDIGDREGEATTLRNLGNVAYLRGEYDRAREYEEESLAIKRDIGDRYGEAASLNNLGVVSMRRGALEEAREYFERSLAIVRDIGDRPGEADALDNLGTVARRRGAFDRGERHHERALEVYRDVGDRRAEAGTLLNLGGIARARDEDERARERFRKALEIARDIDDPRLEGEGHRGLATLVRREGEFDEAREHLDRALTLFENVDAESFVARTRLEEGRLALAEGDLGTATERARAARDSFASLGEKHRRGRSRRLLGRIAVTAGDDDEAREHWRAALETFEDVGATHDELSTLERLVETCREDGDDGTARSLCRRAREVISEMQTPGLDGHREWVDRATAALED